MERGRGIFAILARVVVGIAAIIALIIALGILFQILKANPRNPIVDFIDGLARFLVGPFHDMFKPRDPDARIAVNWGIGLIVYLVIAQVISSVLRRAGATRG